MAEKRSEALHKNSLKYKIHEIIFEANTYWGKVFDISLLVMIFISIIVLMLESVESINNLYAKVFIITEWVLTIIFFTEYILRLYSVRKPLKYATSFYGVIDLLAILPSFLEIFITGSHFFLILRVMRLLRVFRVFKLVRYIDERNTLAYSLRASWPKISYFLFFLLLTVTVIGTAMYLIEGGQPDSNFNNIPNCIYWCIVTLTTVGYGDITPVTPMGRFLASAIMILGYSIIAVPTGIITAEVSKHSSAQNRIKEENAELKVCKNCSEETHLPNAKCCHECGHLL